jgi:Zn-dependent peptidase ImmA (M78 family)
MIAHIIATNKVRYRSISALNNGVCMTKEEMEQEANAFAVALLMPKKMVLADLAALGSIDVCDDPNIRALAKKYGVSEQMMTMRIASLLR